VFILSFSKFDASEVWEWRRKFKRGVSDKQNNPVVTFPIKKRIYSELFIGTKIRGFICKMKSRKCSDLIEEGEWK